tara:strand:+ start:10509 stop:11651 length:1143 start_codon:yes stop_codon:yes gene_type:complete
MIKKILILASYPKSLTNFRGHLIKELYQSGYEVHVAAPQLLEDADTKNALGSLGAKCYNIPLKRNGLSPLSDLNTLKHLYCLMRQVRPNIFLGYTIKPVIWGLYAAKLANIEKRVALVTGLGYAFTGNPSGMRGRIQRLVKYLYKSSLNKATLVFFQNPDDLREFSSKRLIPEECPVKIVNGSGVDTSNYRVSSLKGAPSIRFLLIARLLGDKGIREYVAAARKILGQYSHAEYHLVGGLDTNPDSIPEAELNSWIDEGLITWHGAVNDVRPYIADSHVYVLPSYREGTPRSVLEAMSMGRPIITTDAPGCRETVVNGENGFLVDVKSVDGLVDAMECFIEDTALIETMGKRSREIACEKYDVHKVNDSMLKAMGISTKK